MEQEQEKQHPNTPSSIANTPPVTVDQPFPLWHVPYPRNPFFTGHNHALSHLNEALNQKQATVLSQSYALSGLSGIGKTQTAIEYAYRYANDYAAVFWINAETTESIFAGFAVIADLLDLPAKQGKEQDRVFIAVTRWLSSHNRWLLIFDNVEEIAVVQNYLPTTRGGSLIFTSRRQALGFAAQVVDLGKMTPEEGVRFLLHRSRLLAPTASLNDLAPTDATAAREIVAAMDGLPLALDQAGAYIEETRCSLSDYIQLFRSYSLRLLDEREAHTDHPLSVTRTFALVIESLESNNAAAAELLTVCAFLAPEAIPERFFTEGAAHLGPTFVMLATSPFQFHSVVKALLAYSLLQRNSTTHTLTIHRLVQAVLKGRLSEETQRTWTVLVRRAMTHLFPPDKTHIDYWRTCELFLPHALVCTELSEQWDEEAGEGISLMNHIATYLNNRARYAEAEPLYQRALHIGEDALSSEHPLVAETLHGLATVYSDQGKYKEAEPLFQRSLWIREQTLGAEHPQLASSLNNLAVLYCEQGMYEKAEPLYQRALHIHEHGLDAEHPLLASSLSNLATLYSERGMYEKAEPLYQRALRIYERTLGPEHSQVALPLTGLAVVVSLLWRQKIAGKLFLV